MARIDLPHVQRFKDRHGHLRHYFRKPGCKRVALPGLPGSEAFMTAYKEAVASVREIGADKHPAGTVWALVAAYYQSPDFLGFQRQTQMSCRKVLERFRRDYGDARCKMLEAKHVRNILDKFADRPGMAKDYLKRLRGLFKYALKRELIAVDPTVGVKVSVRATGGFRAWEDVDIERFETFWPVGSRARLALYLLLYTGQRRQDVVRMGRQHVRDGVMTVTQLKRGPTQEPVTLALPLHSTLKAALADLPKDNLTFLMTEYGKPMSPFGFSNWFAECAQKAGLPPRSSPHGLRKAAARRLAEAGASSLQIAAVTGHASLKEVERYTKSASQGRLAVSAMALLQAKG